MADIQVKRKTSVTVTETFYLDGVAANVDSGLPILTLTKPDGTAYTPLPTVLDTWAGPPARTTGQYRFVIGPQPQVTWLDYTLTGTIGGLAQTLEGRIEWIGALLFTLPAFRALKVANGFPFAANATPPYTDAQITDTRAAILDELEQILGFSPVPRFARETLDGNGATELVLPGREATAVLSVTVNGVAKVAADYRVGPGNTIEAVSNWAAGTPFTWGRRNVVVEWVHGLDRVPGKGSHVAMLWTAQELNPSGFSNAVSVSMPDGATYSYNPSERSRFGFERHTGNADLDKWLNRWAVGWAVA